MKSAGFEPKVFYVFSETVPKDAVVELGHEAGTKFQVGEKLKVVISKGPENSFENKTVKMPDISGMTFSEAKKVLNEAGLRVLRANDQYSMTVPKGDIISMNVKVGQTLNTGDIVQLTISMGIEQTSVPNVVYMTKDNAIATLQSNKLKYKVIEEENDTVAEGLVISQSIAAGETTNVQTEVTIHVSIGKYTDVPSLVGVSREAAIRLLEESELRYSILEETNESVAENKVISQSISAGKRVKVRTEVAIVISLGNKTVVPSVTGMDKNSAIQALLDSNLSYRIKESESDSVPEGYVISQSINAGKKVKIQSEVTITISLGKRAAIPNVEGQNIDKALKTLTSRGFSNVSVTWQYHESIAADIVISQNISTSERVKVDTPIQLVVSKGIPQWSEWSTVKPTGNYEIESKTQYRSRTIPVESDWSAWQPYSDSSSNISQQEVQYRYRTRTKNYTTSESASLSGWTRYNSETIGGSGTWSSSKPASGHYETGYLYYHYYADGRGDPHFYADRTEAGARKHMNDSGISWSGVVGYDEKVSSEYYGSNSQGKLYCGGLYLYYSGEVYRETSYTLYYYWQWGDWGSWSDWQSGSVTADDATQVETRYRYKYTQGSTGAWSDWQDSYLSTGTGIEVETQTVYRWKEKIG